jgi:hypothetical protein
MSLSCRLCGNADLTEVVNLGEMSFTGIFPATTFETVPSGPLRVGLCTDCGLAQMMESFPSELLYGDNYGYRSGLNASMVTHLHRTANGLETRLALQAGDLVCDIGSNDATLLNGYRTRGLKKLGIDPTIAKFASFYDDSITAIPDFFSAENYFAHATEPARVVTSLAMFYDLEDPVGFARDVKQVLRDDGIWQFEQSYAPWMVRSGAYDTICHEHLEYYSLSDIRRILDEAGLKIVDVRTNAVNGGSVSVSAAKAESSFRPRSSNLDWLLANEEASGVLRAEAWLAFADRIARHREWLSDLLRRIEADGRTVMGLGASTKGNVLLQSMGLTAKEIPAIGEVNPYKFGRFTPGSHIPIVDEAEVISGQPDYILVLPWHFRESIIGRLEGYLERGGQLIFPLPEVEVLGL